MYICIERESTRCRTLFICKRIRKAFVLSPASASLLLPITMSVRTTISMKLFSVVFLLFVFHCNCRLLQFTALCCWHINSIFFSFVLSSRICGWYQYKRSRAKIQRVLCHCFASFFDFCECLYIHLIDVYIETRAR